VEQTDTQAELDKTFFLNVPRKHKLENVLKGLKKEVGMLRQLAKKAYVYWATVAKELQRRINRKIASLTVEQTDTQAELDKTFFLNVPRKHKLENVLKGLKKEVGVLRQLAKKADVYWATVQTNRDKGVENAQKKAAIERATEQASDQARKQEKGTTDPAEENEHPLQQIKKLGVAGVVSYALWEGGFRTVSGIVELLDSYLHSGRWLDVDVGKVSTEALAFVKLARFVIPLKIGLAAGTGGQTSEDVEWAGFAEDFKVPDGAAVLAEDLDDVRALLELLGDAPLQTGSGIESEWIYENSDSAEPVLICNWRFDIQESDLSDADVIDELKKSFAFPLNVTGSSTLKLNEDGMVQQMKVGSFFINLVSVDDLQELSESDEDKLAQWVKDLFF